jgi:hypothetical protein
MRGTNMSKNMSDIQKVMSEDGIDILKYYEQLCNNTFEIFDEIEKFLENITTKSDS